MGCTYITIQQWMLTELKLKSNELILYALIHGFCQDGISPFYGSLKYMMEMTNLTKESVLSTLQNLVKKGLIVKTDVKSYLYYDKDSGTYKTRTAQGNQHFCLYYTSKSRESAGQESLPAKSKETVHGSKNLTDAGQESLPNKLLDKQADTATENFVDISTADNTTADNPLTENQQTAEAEEIITKSLKNIFDGNLVFDDNFIPGIASLCSQMNLNPKNIFDYLNYCMERTKERKPKSLTNMFYKLAKSKAILQDYIIASKSDAQEPEKTGLICPVCGNKVRPFEQCPECRFDISDRNDAEVINFYRQIYKLPVLKRQSFFSEYNAELKRQTSYSVQERLTNHNLAKMLNDNLNKIRTKYGLKC